jgi:hypothetical protein
MELGFTFGASALLCSLNTVQVLERSRFDLKQVSTLREEVLPKRKRQEGGVRREPSLESTHVAPSLRSYVTLNGSLHLSEPLLIAV